MYCQPARPTARPRRVSEWLAATLEMWCRETGCGFESHALRLERPRLAFGLSLAICEPLPFSTVVPVPVLSLSVSSSTGLSGVLIGFDSVGKLKSGDTLGEHIVAVEQLPSPAGREHQLMDHRFPESERAVAGSQLGIDHEATRL
jgi:hypothetical protein